MRERLAAAMTATEAAITDQAAAWRASGTFHVDPDPKELGALLVTIMQGLAVRARAGAARADLQRVSASALVLLGAQRPGS